MKNSGQLYLLSGLIIGLMAGLVYSLLIMPARYVDAAPHALSPRYKDQYRLMVARSYQIEEDIGRARARLVLLKENDMAAVLTSQAQKALSAGAPPGDVAALSELAQLLQPEGQPTATKQAAPLDPNITPTATLVPGASISTPQPQANNGLQVETQPAPSVRSTQSVNGVEGPFTLRDKQEICDQAVHSALLQIEVEDRDGNPLPGVYVEVTWDGGSDVFPTGLVPQVSPGYADFQMEAEVSYAVRIRENGEVVRDIRAVNCSAPEGGLAYLGGWYLHFAEGHVN